MERDMIIFHKSENEYDGQLEDAQEVRINGQVIGDLFVTSEFGRGWHVVLCGRSGFSNAQFATREGAVKYMKLVAYAEDYGVMV
jgi:hypothetical protein